MTRDTLVTRQQELQHILARLECQRLLTQGALLEIERLLNEAWPTPEASQEAPA